MTKQEEFDAWSKEWNKQNGLGFERRETSDRCAYCGGGPAAGYVVWPSVGIGNPICVPCQQAMVDKLNSTEG